MALDAKTLAEIQRKAQLGIALTNSTADKQSLYDTTRANTDKEIARKAGAGQALTNTGSQYNNDMYAKLVAAQKPVDTGIIATDTTPTNTPSDTPSNTASNYIESINNAKQQAIFAQLDKSKNAALSGLAEERAGVAPRYYESRNQVAAGSQQSKNSLAEFMAARGGTRSGANAQAEISRMGTLQGNLGNLNRQEQQTYDGLDRRTSDLNSAYQSDRASAVAGNEADRMSALLGQYNTDRQYNLELGGQLGSINGQQTLGAQSLGLQKQGQSFDQNMQNKQFDYGVGRDSVLDNRYDQQLERSNFESDRSYDFAKGQQEWSNSFQQGQFDFQKGQQAWENTFQDKSFQQSMNEAAASRGVQWASLGQRDKEFIADQAYREKSFDYQKGQDTIANNLAANKPADYDYKEDADFKADIAGMMSSPLEAATDLRDKAADYIEKYTYEGYIAMLNTIKK